MEHDPGIEDVENRMRYVFCSKERLITKLIIGAISSTGSSSWFINHFNLYRS